VSEGVKESPGACPSNLLAQAFLPVIFCLETDRNTGKNACATTGSARRAELYTAAGIPAGAPKLTEE
jgi:hypothetical protein